MEKVDESEKVLSPGMKYRHYAPKTKCILVYSNESEKLISKIKEISKDYKKVLILSTTENIECYKEYQTINIGHRNNPNEISHNIFSKLRDIDKYDVDIAIIEGVEEKGIGFAIMNRLIRACEYNYIKV